MATDSSLPESLDASVRVASQTVRVAQRGTLIDFLESFLIIILLVLFATTFIVQAFKIPSQSMQPTLLVGDHLLVTSSSSRATAPGMTSSFLTARFGAEISSSSDFRTTITCTT